MRRSLPFCYLLPVTDRKRKRRPPERERRAAAPTVGRAGPAEARLLRLARDLSALARSETAPERLLPAALERLADAWAPGAPLPRALWGAWLAARSDKTATLALAWAREQLRLGLQEILERARKAGQVRADLDAALLAWLLMAGCEAIALEPPGVGPERLRALLEAAGHAAPGS
ncbi:MAG: hypothetical protein HY727_18220 [Candidatus Rokubacteria bacterium]|nr:hypothetical protein [Candidatus Rokubacteria bacterium]